VGFAGAALRLAFQEVGTKLLLQPGAAGLGRSFAPLRLAALALVVAVSSHAQTSYLMGERWRSLWQQRRLALHALSRYGSLRAARQAASAYQGTCPPVPTHRS